MSIDSYIENEIREAERLFRMLDLHRQDLSTTLRNAFQQGALRTAQKQIYELNRYAESLEKLIGQRESSLGRGRQESGADDFVFVLSEQRRVFLHDLLFPCMPSLKQALVNVSIDQVATLASFFIGIGPLTPSQEVIRGTLKDILDWYVHCDKTRQSDFKTWFKTRHQTGVEEINEEIDSERFFVEKAEAFLLDDDLWWMLDFLPLGNAQDLRDRANVLKPIVLSQGKLNSAAREVYAEICKAFIFGNFLASAALCRSLVEMVIKEKHRSLGVELFETELRTNPRRKTLEELVDALPTDFDLIRARLHVVRSLGNDALHEQKVSITKNNSDYRPLVPVNDLCDAINTTREFVEATCKSDN